MKKTFKRVLIASTVMLTALTAGVLTSCVRGSFEDQKRKEGYIYTVTYDANGGSFGTTSRTYALVKENYPTLAPGYVDSKTQISIKVPNRMDYELVGEAVDNGNEDRNEEAILSKSWFLAQTDDNGNVLYDNEGEPLLVRDTPWNFATDKVTEDITLVAKWTQQFRFAICLVDVDANNNPIEREIGSAKAKVGETIYDKLYNKEADGSIIRRPDKIVIKQSGYTLLDFYTDNTYQTLLQPDYAHPGTQVIGTETDPETGEIKEIKTNTVKIYASYLKGSFDFVTNKNKPTLKNTSNWYVLEDVDYAGAEWKALSGFKGTIYGNGYTLKNFTVKSTATSVGVNESKNHSIFGAMSGTIENLTLENVSLRVETTEGSISTGNHNTVFLASEFAETASMQSVTLKDCQLLLKVLAENGGKLFTYATGEYGGLWWTAPVAEQVALVIKENDQVVETIKVVEQ